jgi:hypothetical protein
MTLMLVALVAGCAGGMATGGHLSGLARLRVRAWPLLGVAIIVQACMSPTAEPVRGALAVAGCAAIAIWCIMNHGSEGLSKGVGLVAVGVITNAIVIATNGGMPVSAPALAGAGMPRAMNVAVGHLYKHVVMTGNSRLAILGDAIPVRLAHAVISPGDIVMLAGIAVVAWGATRRTRTSRNSAVRLPVWPVE